MQEYLEQAWQIWQSGGLLMWPLALVGMIIYATFLDLFLHLFRHEVVRMARHPAAAPPGPLRHWFHSVRSECQTPDEVTGKFHEARLACLDIVDRRILFLQRILPTGPLLGLLGTVTGMLVTFSSLGAGQQGGLIDLVATGISEALITTQTGLLIAAPGYLLLSILRKRRDLLERSLSHLECMAMDAAWCRIHRSATRSRTA